MEKDYAASVRRLIRDGVDVPLGNLFVTATRANNDHERARSASEAFLFQHLESLPETTGLFRLNAKLPIPFDGWSEMEIDLYCAELKLAIEIDGPQHLSNPAPIAVTAARTPCFRKAAAMSCVSSPKTSANIWMPRSMPSYAPLRTFGGIDRKPAPD